MAAPTASDRLFLAVLPEPSVAERIVHLATGLFARHGVKARPMAAERLHLTMRYLGDFNGLPEAFLAGVWRAMDALEGTGFAVVFDRAQSFDGHPRHVPWVITGDGPDMEALQVLHSQIGRRLDAAGIRGQGKQKFRPHITVGYAGKALAACDIEPCLVDVRDIVLVHSFIGRGRHEVLRRWSLQSAD